MITEQQLKEHGALIIAARRRVWDLERKLGTRPWDNFIKHDLLLARRAYSVILKERKAMIASAQPRII